MSEKEPLPIEDKNEIIVYQPEGGEFHIEVRVENETVWLTQAQMAELFSKSISVISRHIANVFAEHELEEKSNLHFLQIANSGMRTGAATNLPCSWCVPQKENLSLSTHTPTIWFFRLWQNAPRV